MMRFAKAPAVLIVLGLGAWSMVSCGDDPEALSKPEFISQANAICLATDVELQPLWEDIWEGELDFEDPEDQGPILVRFAEAMDTIGPAWSESIKDIRALEPPADDEDEITAILDDLELAIDDFRATAVAAAAGDEAARERLAGDSEEAMADVNQRAREYGLTVCGSED